MKIDKSKLKTLWYEDKSLNEVEVEEVDELISIDKYPEIVYQVSRFPLEVQTTYLRLIKKEDVEACKHEHKYIRRTFGWVKGIKGRECQICHGTQVRKRWQPWGRKWDAYGSRKAVTFTTNISDEKTILAMVNSGDYSLKEAIIAYSMACEKCMNVLAYKYSNGLEGYAEGSAKWAECRTSCVWCKAEQKEV